MKYSILTIAFIGMSFFSHAQIKAVTFSGDTVLLFENKTWKHQADIVAVDTDVELVRTTVNIDEMNGSKSIVTQSWRGFGLDQVNEKVTAYMKQSSGFTLLALNYTGDLGCFSKYSSKIEVKLTNGDIIEFIQISDTECGENDLIYFAPLSKDGFNDSNYKEIMAENVKTLSQHDWSIMRLHGSRYNTTLKPLKSAKNPNPEQFFRVMIASINAAQ